MKKNTEEKDNYLVIIGLRIKEIRKKNKITQEDLAKMMETSQPQIARIESGEQNASILVYKKLATILGVTMEDLVRDN